MSYDEYDTGGVKELALGERYQRARKQHRCCSCSRPILPGTVYRAEFGLVDGEAYYVKTCYTCLERERRA